jgi:uncharacterized membrane protein
MDRNLQGFFMEGNSSLGMKENIAGLVSYLGFWVTGIIFFVLEKQNRFVKFHAVQSLVTFASLFITLTIFNIFCRIPIIGIFFWILSFINYLAIFILWIAGMISSYQGKTVKFPLFGDIAESFINKNNP